MHVTSGLGRSSEPAINTVDGRNPALVDVGSLSHYLQGGFIFEVGFLAGFLNHQQ